MKKIILALAGLLSLLIIKPVLADQSCYINSSAAGIYTVPNDPASPNLNPGIVDGPVNYVESANGEYDYRIPFRGSNPIGCKSAAPWDNSVHVITDREVAIKWSAAPDMTPQTVLYRRPVAQFSNFQPKIVSSWLILALFQANFLISGRSRLCPYQLVNSNQVRQGE